MTQPKVSYGDMKRALERSPLLRAILKDRMEHVRKSLSPIKLRVKKER